MHFLTLVAVVSAAVSGASAIVIPGKHVRHARTEKPATYYEPYLEPYDTYHTRYETLGCEDKHDTQFFADCCHPMLSTETLQGNRKAYCNPANVVSSTAVSSTASAATATGTQVLSTGDDEDCDDEDDSGDDEDDCDDTDDEDDEDCDEDDSTSSAVPTSTSVSHSSSAAPVTSTHASSTKAETTSTKVEATSTKVETTSTKDETTSTVAPTTSTHKASPTSTSKSSTATSGSSTFSGDATFFYQLGQAGACGIVHQDSDFVIALQTELYGNINAKSSNCGRKIKLTNTKNGKTVEAVVADACPTCTQGHDLDLSFGAFMQIATEEEGEVPITWQFIS
ncbi:RlpA-like double-psi beta-barrel-protein domain-containing protein-containing protein [Epithele typhae]|uniref:RlpA-like double-psi beta-barrel-protein domain-containing protein-containing protein n=1 Tax=Epithele typhae TaxID=378194 RepID=UPI0020072951|nr:RlpA-like double-psi beta-barrel-protein domain-containing protein-containing protein [Epithele typhae]KAH9946091.1 RlpA-like double-psi beta-barrel-protein domain-containing protein-containing protein [Epithele typhae]